MGKARNEDCGPMDLNSLQFNIIRLELEEDASHTALSLVYMAIVYFLWPCRSRSALSGTRPLLVSMVYVFQSFPSREMLFAGHPTLGSCVAWLHAGGVPKHLA